MLGLYFNFLKHMVPKKVLKMSTENKENNIYVAQ